MKNQKMLREVCIIGAAYTTLGDVRSTEGIKGLSERELCAAASMEAMEDAGIRATDVDAFYLGMSSPNYYSKIKSAGPQLAPWAGMFGKPSLFHDEGCGTALFGVQMAAHAVAAGAAECVMSTAVGITQSSPIMAYPPHIRGQLDEKTMWEAINTGMDCAYEKPGASTSTGPEGQVLRYAKEFGVSFDDLDLAQAQYAIDARKNALLNPKATLFDKTYEQEAEEMGFDDVYEFLTDEFLNPRAGTFLRMRFIGLHADGASSVIVCSKEFAEQLGVTPIEISGIATGGMQNKDFIDFPGIQIQGLFDDVYAQAGIKDPAKEIDYMAIHDVPITTILNGVEAAGYCPMGEGWKYMREGRMSRDGDRPVNTEGGRTQVGHPFGASFGIEITEAVKQMRGEADARQITDHEVRKSLIYGGGSGINCGAMLLSKD